MAPDGCVRCHFHGRRRLVAVALGEAGLCTYAPAPAIPLTTLLPGACCRSSENVVFGGLAGCRGASDIFCAEGAIIRPGEAQPPFQTAVGAFGGLGHDHLAPGD